ncbi:MAG TPA: POTRA domain-containing protein, partial [Candidatus Kapabacteria bacterium]|nr:POTRA domain-containing protein [Candidatus Kapabacteria bacterium]
MRFFAFVFIAVTVSCAFAQEGELLNDKPIDITSVTFTGNKAFSSDKLQAIIQTNISTWGVWRFFTGAAPSYLDYLTIAQDSVAIQNLYKQNGFLFAQVHPAVVIDTSHITASVTFTIEEGIQSTVDTVIIGGLARLSTDERNAVNGIMTLHRGDVYSRSRLLDSLGSIVMYLRNIGYRFALLSGSPRVTLDNNLR